jgi:hypothetical protein
VKLASWTFVLALGCGLGACRRAPAPEKVVGAEPVDQQALRPGPPKSTVRWFGTLRSIMHEGRTQAAVRLSEVVPGPHAWGLGALEGLHGEATLLDDVAWLARPTAEGTAQVGRAELGGADATLGAALFVVANVEAWQQVVVQTEVPWDRLDAFIEAELAARAVALDAPVAVRVEGPVANLHWHVVDGSKLVPGAGHAEHARTAVSGVVDQADARLVGFFSTSHQGVFTHAGSRTHFHVLIEVQHLSGHVDAVGLRPGARLLIAAR